MMEKKKPVILLVDDENDILADLKTVLQRDDYSFLLADNAERALAILRDYHVDVIISDFFMEGIAGNDLLSEVRNSWPHIVRILITGYADFDAAVQAINEGKVFRILVKPWDNNELRIIVKQALKYQEMMVQNKMVMNEMRRRKGVFSTIEEQFSGVALVNTTSDGAVITDEDDVIMDVPGLLKNLQA